MASTASNQQPEAADQQLRPTFLRRVSIRGYKSIGFCDVALAPLTVLVGRNASGKSNFLDALAFLRDAMETNVGEAVKRRGGWPAIACRVTLPGRITAEVEAAFTGGPPPRLPDQHPPPAAIPPPHYPSPPYEGVPFLATYRVAVERGPNEVPIVAEENLHFHGPAGTPDVGFDRDPRRLAVRWHVTGEEALLPPGSDSSRYRPDQLVLSLLGNQPYIALADELRSMAFYNFHPETIRQPHRPATGYLLDRDGANLASVLATLAENDPESVDRVRDYLALVSPGVEGFERLPVGAYETVRFRQRAHAPGGRLDFDAAGMSDGTLRALASLAAAYQVVVPLGHASLIGIEEPETSLHPAATRALVAALQEATTHTQVLLTTHSGDLLADRDVVPEQVLVVRSEDGLTRIAPVDPASREIVRKELYTLADLQRMDQLEPDAADLARQAAVGANGKEGWEIQGR